MTCTAFVIGNIASGKSTACRYLAAKGARHIDLDAVAKDLYVPGSLLVEELANAFGWDIINEFGGIDTQVLAARAFETPESTQALNDIVHPAVKKQLSTMIFPVACCSTIVPDYPLTIVEISVAAAMRDVFPLADEIIAITTPLEVRRDRALERGMTLDDFEMRAAAQPTEDELCSWASFTADNSQANDSLYDQLDTWLDARQIYLEGRA